MQVNAVMLLYSNSDVGGPFEERTREFAKFVSRNLKWSANKIDLFLAGKKYTAKPNPTSANLSQYVTYLEGGHVKTSTDFGLNMRLPNVEKRWQLRFSSYDEDKENRDLSQRRVRTQARPTDYGAAFQFFEKLGNIKTTFQPRVVLKNPVGINYILRFETVGEIKRFRVVPRVDFFADAGKGTGVYSSLEFQWEISRDSDLTWNNSQEYRDQENYYLVQHGFSYDHSVGYNKAIGGSVTTSYNNRQTYHLHSLDFSIDVTQTFYDQLVSASLSPFIGFGKGDHFKGKTGITFAMKVAF